MELLRRGFSTDVKSGVMDLKTDVRDFRKAMKRFGAGQALRERQTDEILDEVDELDFRAWVDEAGILRRLTTDIDFDGGSVALDMRIEEPNEPVEIRVPTGAEPISELLQRLGVPPDALLGPGAQLPVPG